MSERAMSTVFIAGPIVHIIRVFLMDFIKRLYQILIIIYTPFAMEAHALRAGIPKAAFTPCRQVRKRRLAYATGRRPASGFICAPRPPAGLHTLRVSNFSPTIKSQPENSLYTGQCHLTLPNKDITQKIIAEGCPEHFAAQSKTFFRNVRLLLL
jgi:hypothetical protein